MLYLRHPAWLWIKKHAKHLMPPIDEALQARFDEGHAFEPFVESLFPDLTRVGFESYLIISICLKKRLKRKNGLKLYSAVMNTVHYL